MASLTPLWNIIEHVIQLVQVYVMGTAGDEAFGLLGLLFIHNHGCPCPGVGDAALRVSDTHLHFVDNAIA